MSYVDKAIHRAFLKIIREYELDSDALQEIVLKKATTINLVLRQTVHTMLIICHQNRQMELDNISPSGGGDELIFTQ